MKLSDQTVFDVRPLLTRDRSAFLELLSMLDGPELHAPTVCPAWSVKDVCLHLLDGDFGWLSRDRDGDRSSLLLIGDDYGAFVEALNTKNRRWVEAARGLSPRMIQDLLRFSGAQVDDFYATIPLDGTSSVAWVGPEPVPMWFDLARDFTERWVHHQQVRDAVGRPGLFDDEWVGPVVRTFVWALPRSYHGVDAPTGSVVQLQVHGPGGGSWSLLREDREWVLNEGQVDVQTATVTMSSDAAWRLFTGALRRTDSVSIVGDESLAMPLLDARGIIV